MPSPRCEFLARLETWPYAKRCEDPAILRVRLFDPDDTTQDLDLCAPHAGIAGGEYPDAIETLTTYT